jgi:hypothetical protein
VTDLDKAFSADDSLPPVEPPSAGFIVQLFVVPAIIVLIVVAVSLLFNWLAHMGRDPKEYIAQIRQGRTGAWQAAHDLATEIAQDRELRRNGELAESTHALLLAKLNEPVPPSAADREAQVNLLFFLTSALGRFEQGDVLPGLLQAATAERADSTAIAAGAVESLAALADLRGPDWAAQHPEVGTTLISLTETDREPDLQARAAFALGVWGGDAVTGRLRSLLESGQREVRFNAATGLARHELNDETLSEVRVVVMEMLALGHRQEEASSRERSEADWFLALKNGLTATKMLVEHHPNQDFSELRTTVEDVRDAAKAGRLPQGFALSIELQAAELLRTMNSAGSP